MQKKVIFDMVSKRKTLSRSCKQKNNLLHEDKKDAKPRTRKQRESLKCKPIHAVKGNGSAENFEIEPLFDECYSSKRLLVSSISRTWTSVVKPCEVRLAKMKISNMQKLDPSSKHKRKPMTSKVSQVSDIMPIMPADGTRRSLRSSVSLRSCQSSEKTLRKSVTPQKQSKYRKKNERKSLVTSPNQEFPITSTPIQKNTASKYKPNEISKERSSAGRMASQSSQLISLESSNELSRSSSNYSLRSRSSSKSISNSIGKLTIGKGKPKEQAETLQSLTPIRKKTISKRVSSISYEKKASKRNQKSCISSSKSDSKTSGFASSKKTNGKTSAKSHKHLHAGRKNVSDILFTDSTLPGIPLQPRKVKSDNFRLPGKNTLKRKRYTMEALKKLDENYEDDIYQPQKFENFKDLLLCSPDSNTSVAMSTPKLAFQVTPLIRHKTPKFKDFFSPTSYAKSRKLAEECMYRKKKKKHDPPEIPVEPEKKKLEFSAVISEACKIQQSLETMAEGSDEENSYFSFTE